MEVATGGHTYTIEEYQAVVAERDEALAELATLKAEKQGCGKEKTMEEMGMTDKQFEKMLKLIIMIIESSESKEEAIKKIKELLNNK